MKAYITNFTLALFSLLYLIRLLTILDVKFYMVIYRVNYLRSFDPLFPSDSLIVIAIALFVINYRARRISLLIASSVSFLLVIISPNYITDVVALLIPIPLLLYIYNKADLKLFLFNLLLIILAIEFISLIRWISYPIFPTIIFEDPSWAFSLLEAKLFYSFGMLSPYLMLLVLLSFIIKFYISRFKISSIRIDVLSRFDVLERVKPIIDHRVILLSAFILIFILSIYPYIPTINPDFKRVSVDEPYYLGWLNDIRGSDDPLKELFVVSNGSRPLTLLIMLALEEIGIPSLLVVRFFHLMLAPILMIAVYYFVKHSANKKLAAFSTLMTAFSYHIIVGIYAGLLANMLALIPAYLALLFAIRVLDDRKFTNSLLLFALLTLTMLTHTYTWSFLITALILFTILSLITERRYRSIIILSSIIVVSIIIDYIRADYTNSITALSSNVNIATNALGISYFTTRWDNLEATFYRFLGGYFTNATMLILVLIWALKAKYTDKFDRMLLASIFIGLLPVLFGNATIQSRMFYNMPLHIPAAIMLYNSNKHGIFGNILFLTILMQFINYAFRAVANMYLP